MDCIPLVDLTVLVMKYCFTYVKPSRVLEPAHGHALAVQDLGDAFDVTLVLPGHHLLQCPYCRGVLSHHRFRECP